MRIDSNWFLNRDDWWMVDGCRATSWQTRLNWPSTTTTFDTRSTIKTWLWVADKQPETMNAHQIIKQKPIITKDKREEWDDREEQDPVSILHSLSLKSWFHSHHRQANDWLSIHFHPFTTNHSSVWFRFHWRSVSFGSYPLSLFILQSSDSDSLPLSLYSFSFFPSSNRTISLFHILARIPEVLCKRRVSKRLRTTKGGLHGMPSSWKGGESIALFAFLFCFWAFVQIWWTGRTLELESKRVALFWDAWASL